MPAANPIVPKGGRNHIQTLYISPITDNAPIAFLTKGTSGTEFGTIDNTIGAFNLDKINEYTAAAGVTIDSLRIKDGGARLSNAVALSARNSANAADIDLITLDAADTLVVGGANDDTTFKVGGTKYWNISTLGNFQPETDGANAIGAATKRVGNIYTENIRRAGGNLELITDDASAIVAYTNSVAHLRLESGGNLGLWGSSYGSGTKVIFIGNCSATPSGTPASGGVLYVESGALKYKGSGGLVTTIAAAS